MSSAERESLLSLTPTGDDADRAHPLRDLTPADAVVIVYLAVLLAVTALGDGPRRATALGYLAADILVFAVALVLSKTDLLPRRAAEVVHRLALFTAVFGTFTQLHYILPTARATQVDAEIVAFDELVFGVEPALALDRFVTTATVEWFSFFYFGYFIVIAAHVFPFMFLGKDGRLVSELTFGLVTLFCVGHLLYLVVPGFGPYQHLAARFTRELDGPVWWPLVKATVDAGDVRARTDIFPSLHTAAPTFLAIFSTRHRRVGTFRVTWLPMVFFASQITLSTMFLRWHYLVDVIAGLALAAVVARLSPRFGTARPSDPSSLSADGLEAS